MIYIWDLQTKKIVQKLEGHKGEQYAHSILSSDFFNNIIIITFSNTNGTMDVKQCPHFNVTRSLWTPDLPLSVVQCLCCEELWQFMQWLRLLLNRAFDKLIVMALFWLSVHTDHPVYTHTMVAAPFFLTPWLIHFKLKVDSVLYVLLEAQQMSLDQFGVLKTWLSGNHLQLRIITVVYLKKSVTGAMQMATFNITVHYV